ADGNSDPGSGAATASSTLASHEAETVVGRPQHRPGTSARRWATCVGRQSRGSSKRPQSGGSCSIDDGYSPAAKIAPAHGSTSDSSSS
ncbi:MAG: hypothetical protein JWM12_1598, partial [Ilumatobacteraceae bacterium]|nr:hypothetical protein [Ilumatobacteraceae bacterium]